MSIKLPFGLKNGEILHISEVESGLSCGCICPNCSDRLKARKGTKNVHHFAHVNSDCNKGLETALHLLAKKILKENMEILLPPVSIMYADDFGHDHLLTGSKTIYNSQKVKFDEVILEKKMGDIISDVVGYVRNKPLLIEIKVTHGIDKEKKNKIENMKISCIEIDLSNLKEEKSINPNEIKELIINKVLNKKWIYNAKLEKYLEQENNNKTKQHIKKKKINTIQNKPKERKDIYIHKRRTIKKVITIKAFAHIKNNSLAFLSKFCPVEGRRTNKNIHSECQRCPNFIEIFEGKDGLYVKCFSSF